MILLLHIKGPLYRGILNKKSLLDMGANSCFKVDPFSEGREQIHRVVSLESLSIPFKPLCHLS